MRSIERAMPVLLLAVCNLGQAQKPILKNDESIPGRPIIMMFRWDARDKERPVWGQAFSPDNGKTWEWNWFNVSERVAP